METYIEKNWLNGQNLNEMRHRAKSQIKPISGVYIIFNKQTRRRYVGSSNNLRVRVLNQISYLKKPHKSFNRGLKEDFDKFGFENYGILWIYTKTPRVLETDLLQQIPSHLLFNSIKIGANTGSIKNFENHNKNRRELALKQWSRPEHVENMKFQGIYQYLTNVQNRKVQIENRCYYSIRMARACEGDGKTQYRLKSDNFPDWFIIE